jgi:hypothetical protein
MKILPFNPMDISPKKPQGPPVKSNEMGSDSFQNTLAASMNARDRVSQENLRANNTAKIADLKEAKDLISTLVDQMQAIGPEGLKRTHNLEGLLYYFPA